MLATASRLQVPVAVFNEPLLAMGAAFSATAVNDDIAATITRALNEILDGDIDAVPAVSALNEIRITPNPQALRRLGLNVPDDGEPVAKAQ